MIDKIKSEQKRILLLLAHLPILVMILKYYGHTTLLALTATLGLIVPYLILLLAGAFKTKTSWTSWGLRGAGAFTVISSFYYFFDFISTTFFIVMGLLIFLELIAEFSFFD